LVSWELEKSLSTSLYFVVFFGVFLLFAAYEFWFVFFMERRCLAHELVMELGSQDYLLVPKIIFWFPRLSFIVKMKQRGWQCAWWWKRINT